MSRSREALFERRADTLEAGRLDAAQVGQRQRRIAGGHLLHADEVRVQRLTTVVEFDLDVRELQLDVLPDPLRFLRRRVTADEHSDEFAVVVHEVSEQRAHRVAPASRRPRQFRPVQTRASRPA